MLLFRKIRIAKKYKEKKYGYEKKGIGKWIAIVVVVIVIIAAVAGNTGKEGSEKVGNVQDNQQTVSDNGNDNEAKSKGSLEKDESEDDLSDEGEDEKSEDEENGGKYHPGDIVSYEDFEITYKSAGKYKSKNQFVQPKKGFRYIKFDFTFKNVGDADTMIGSFECYADGEKCEREYISETGGDFLLETLSSGRKVSGSLVFEVPTSVKMKDIEVEYENYSFVSDEKVIFIAK